MISFPKSLMIPACSMKLMQIDLLEAHITLVMVCCSFSSVSLWSQLTVMMGMMSFQILMPLPKSLLMKSTFYSWNTGWTLMLDSSSSPIVAMAIQLSLLLKTSSKGNSKTVFRTLVPEERLYRTTVLVFSLWRSPTTASVAENSLTSLMAPASISPFKVQVEEVPSALIRLKELVLPDPEQEATTPELLYLSKIEFSSYFLCGSSFTYSLCSWGSQVYSLVSFPFEVTTIFPVSSKQNSFKKFYCSSGNPPNVVTLLVSMLQVSSWGSQFSSLTMATVVLLTRVGRVQKKTPLMISPLNNSLLWSRSQSWQWSSKIRNTSEGLMMSVSWSV